MNIGITGALIALVASLYPAAPRSTPPATPVRLAMMCMKTGEDAPVGMTKICYYDCLGSRVAITIRATSICPLSINR